MSEQISELLNVSLTERNLPNGDAGVAAVLQLKTRRGGVNELEIVLSADLAVQYGKALAALGSDLGGQ